MKLHTFALFLLFAASAASAQTLGSCQIFPSNNPWNQRVDTLPVHWNSAAYIAHVGATTHVHPDFGSDPSYGIPWVAVNASQAFVPIDLSNGYFDQSDPGPMPIPPNAPVEGGGVGDAHVLVVDTSNHHLYELYQGIKGSGSGWAATSSAVFGLDSNNYRPDGWTSCDAAGLPIWPGLVRKYECDAGEIKHALRFTVHTTQKGWIFPARHHAGATTDTTVMPMGLRMRLKATFDDSKFTGYAKVISTAMKRYGIILADNGSNWFISGETNTSWPDNDINQLKTIAGSDFEAVYTGPVRTTPNQYPDPVLPIPGGGGSTGKISAEAIARDTVLAGTSNTFSVVVKNTGSAAIHVSTIKIKNGTVYSITSTPIQTIPANDSSSVTVKFSPLTPGVWVDTLTIKSDDPVNPGLKVALVGLGTSGVFHVASTAIDFGSVRFGSADTMTITMSNTGNGTLIVNTLSPGGSNPDFTVIGVQPPSFPPLTMKAGDSVVASVRFAPSGIGFDSSVFALNISNYTGEQHDTNVKLFGEGISNSSVAATESESFDLTVFPNPSSGLVTVSFTGAEGSSQIELTDAIGRSVLKQTIQSGSGTVDLSGLPNGCYFLHAQTSQGEGSKLIAVLH